MPVTKEQHFWRFVQWVLVLLIASFLVFCGWWRVQGGTWKVVETPSMGTVAPVGSLLWVKPVDASKLTPGEFITFHPPGDGSTTYSHRVYRIDSAGIMTKGVIPAPDPWHLHPQDIVGKVATVWWGVGWIVKAGPILIIGGLIAYAICRMLRQHLRLPAAVLLGSMVVTVAITWYRPFVNAEELAFAPGNGGATATYVGTGLLPIKLSASQPQDAGRPGGSAVMRDGQIGTVTVTQTDAHGRWRVNLSPAIPLWWWIVLVLGCFLPALWTLVVGLPPLPEEPKGAADDSGVGPEPA